MPQRLRRYDRALRGSLAGGSIDAATKYGEISTLSPTLAGRMARCIGPPFHKLTACGSKRLLHPLRHFKCALVPSRARGSNFPLPSWERDRGRGGDCAIDNTYSLAASITSHRACEFRASSARRKLGTCLIRGSKFASWRRFLEAP